MGHTLAGHTTNPGNPLFVRVQSGLAPDATLWSGSIATSISGGSFNISSQSFITAYSRFMQVGVNPLIGDLRTADVINSSWGGGGDPSGYNYLSVALDGLANATGKTVVVAAGNSGHVGINNVGSPGNGFNIISAAALGTDTSVPAYNSVSSFSSGGPQDFFNPQTNVRTVGARAAVDLAAPGEQLTLAVVNSPGFYNGGLAGTSFASPTIAGGAALLVDAGRAVPGTVGTAQTIDGRTIKAVLLNSADKIPGWNNGQFVNGGGVITTTQALDYNIGAGRMDLNRAYDQFFAGTRGVPGGNGGNVSNIGWDFGLASQSRPSGYTNYRITPLLQAGTEFTATLDWFLKASTPLIAGTNPGDFDAPNVAWNSFENLNLELWSVTGGNFNTLIAQSDSAFNDVQQFDVTLPGTGYYGLRVKWAGEAFNFLGVPQDDPYGLAWSGVAAAVPEPTTFVLAGMSLVSLMAYRWRGRRRVA